MVNQFTYPEKWRVLDLSHPSASQNLALEEALLQGGLPNDFNPTVRLWIDPKATVIGRFQDVNSEVDVEFCRRNGIQVVRRFTGGGAVYHDGGNLNFTIVMPKPETIGLLEFHRINASIIQDCVTSLGLESVFVSPNSIEVSSKKISGAAACFGRKLALWHSSILVSTDTTISAIALAPSRREAKTTGVRSRWKPMTTLEALLGKPMPLSHAKTILLQSFQKLSNSRLQRMPTTLDEERLTLALLANKYSKYEWNYLGESNV